MNKKYEVDKYLEIQYPIIKNEVSQANSSLGMILSFIWGLLAIIVSLLLSVWLTVELTKVFIICWSITSGVFVAIVVVLLIKSFKVFNELRPNINRVKIKTLTEVPSYHVNKTLENRLNEFNPTYFATFEFVSKDEFVELFDHKNDEMNKLMLAQAYINGRIAYKKYKVAKKTTKFNKL